MENESIILKTGNDIAFEQVVELYNSLGWYAYTNEKQVSKLQDALNNSTYVISAWKEDLLIGLARCISDDVSIFYLQDILIHPDHQRKGVGSRLLKQCINRFDHVRAKVLLTDDEEKQKSFYESLGYKNVKDLTKVKLNSYVIIHGVE